MAEQLAHTDTTQEQDLDRMVTRGRTGFPMDSETYAYLRHRDRRAASDALTVDGQGYHEGRMSGRVPATSRTSRRLVGEAQVGSGWRSVTLDAAGGTIFRMGVHIQDGLWYLCERCMRVRGVWGGEQHSRIEG